MRKILFCFLLIFLIRAAKVDSTEKEFVLSGEMAYDLSSEVSQLSYFDYLPENPNVFTTIWAYSDEELTVPVKEVSSNSKITPIRLITNNRGEILFELEDGTYILARHDIVYDDVILNTESTNSIYWLKKGFTVYSSAITNQAKVVSTNLTEYQSIQVSDLVTTPKGIFAKVNQGYISLDDLSSEDNRMDKVQNLLNEKYNSNDYGIYVQQLKTDKVASVNGQEEMYGASVAKLAVLYYTQLLLDKGQVNLANTYKYIPEVNSFSGSYQPEGSGSMPKTADNKDYSLSDLINRTSKESDNVASNMLAYYIANQYNDQFNLEIEKISKGWDLSIDRNMTAEMAGQVMAALYKLKGNDILSALSSTDFDDQRISKDIEVQVAHKIGDAYDYKHDVAVVYSDSPFVLSIFTNNSSYDKIAEIAKEIYEILK